MKKSHLSIGLIAVVLIILILHINYLRFICDDAFISFRYAKNFVEGHGLVYNIGERVEGYMNFLWTLFLSAFIGLGMDVVVVSQVLGILFSLSTVLLLLYFNRKLYPEESLFNYLAPLFLGCCGAYAAWATGGLETSFYTFLVFLGSFLFITGMNKPRYFIFSGMAFALVCITRLDGLIFAGITFIWLFYLTVFKKRIEFKALVIWTLCFLVPFLTYFFWRWSYYGRFLPNTFYVKVGGMSFYRQGFLYVLDFVKRFWIWLFIVPFVFLNKSARANSKLNIIIPYFTSLIVVFFLYVVYVGGDFMDMYRFLVPILPFFFFLAQEGFRGMYHYSRSKTSLQDSLKGKRRSKPNLTEIKNRKVILIAMETSLIIFIMILLAFPSIESNREWNRNGIDSIGLLREYSRLWTKVGLMFKEIAKPGESLSTRAAGAIPYYSGLYAIDELLLTLKPYPTLKVHNVPRVGHQKVVPMEFLASKKPTHILNHPQIRDEYIQPEEIPVDSLFSNIGYKMLITSIYMSKKETKYFYCLSLKTNNSKKLK